MLGTLEKVKRNHTRLSTMRDIADARVVGTWRLSVQDALAQKIVDRFPGALMVDRRRQPTHGYRAVHVVVPYKEVVVEIQVRTEMQDKWAQLFETLADRVGRDIRYRGVAALGGDAPLAPTKQSQSH